MAFALLLEACAAQRPIVEPPFIGPLLPPSSSCSWTVERVAAFDEPTPLGLSAVEALAQLAADRSAPLVWLEPPASPDYLLEYGPEQGASALALTIVPADGELEYHVSEPAPGADADTECDGASLHIPVLVTLRSTAGALDEMFRTMLEVSAPFRARLRHVLSTPPDGALVVGPPQSLHRTRAAWLTPPRLDIALWPGGSRGVLSVEVGVSTLDDRGAVRFDAPPARQYVELAAWPSAAPCPDGMHALPSTARVLGFSAHEVREALRQAPPEELHWDNGATTSLALEIAELPDELCQAYEDALEFDAEVTARSDDARLHARLLVRVRAESEHGTVGAISLSSVDATPDGALAGPARRPELNQHAPPRSPPEARADLAELEAHYFGSSASGVIALPADAADEARGTARGEWSR